MSQVAQKLYLTPLAQCEGTGASTSKDLDSEEVHCSSPYVPLPSQQFTSNYREADAQKSAVCSRLEQHSHLLDTKYNHIQ